MPSTTGRAASAPAPGHASPGFGTPPNPTLRARKRMRRHPGCATAPTTRSPRRDPPSHVPRNVSRMPIDASPVQPLPSRVAIVRAMAGTGDLRLGALGQVSLHVRDTTRAERFYGETLGLRHLYTFGDLAFFDLDG